MRTKIFVLLALLVAFSTASFAQVSHDVSVDLTENRTLTLNGFPPTLDVTRLSDTAILVPGSWTSDVSTTLGVDHDLGLDQKITVGVAITTGDWADRYLKVVAAEAPAWTAPAAVTPSAERTLISDGVAAGVQDLATAVKATAFEEFLSLTYTAAAGLDATAGSHKATITYTIVDN